MRLRPADHGRPMTLEEFMVARSVEGYHYELIDGKLYVSLLAELPENRVENWIYFKLKLFAHHHPEIVNFVSSKARVFVPGRQRVTAPEPDVAAYRNYPLDLPWDSVRWQDVSPILVVEVLSPAAPDKDLVRNVDLYLQVPSIGNTGCLTLAMVLNAFACKYGIAMAAAGGCWSLGLVKPTLPSSCPISR